MNLPDSFERLIKLLGRFPGIGAKTARRMVFFVLEQDAEWARDLARALSDLHEQVRPCEECGAIATEDLCSVCANPDRDRGLICVVETQEDCAAMEASGVFNGLYHVLGGRCSPLEGQEVPVSSLELLKSRIEGLGVREVILAFNPRVEGDMTAYVVQDALVGLQVKLTRLAYGLPVGGSIGYADRMTLHVSLESRQEMQREDCF